MKGNQMKIEKNKMDLIDRIHRRLQGAEKHNAKQYVVPRSVLSQSELEDAHLGIS